MNSGNYQFKVDMKDKEILMQIPYQHVLSS